MRLCFFGFITAIFEWAFTIHLQDCFIGEFLLIEFFSDWQNFLLIDVSFM